MRPLFKENRVIFFKKLPKIILHFLPKMLDFRLLWLIVDQLLNPTVEVCLERRLWNRVPHNGEPEIVRLAAGFEGHNSVISLDFESHFRIGFKK